MPTPGEIIPAAGDIQLNAGRESRSVHVRNDSEVFVHVTSHYHFFEANKHLAFDRRAAYGMRLDVAAGTGVRWEPGETKEVSLVALTGRREVYGFNGFINGPLDAVDVDDAVARLVDEGFANEKIESR
jgi:urease beta subunit